MSPIRYNLCRACLGRGFTLIELLVVMAIIAIMGYGASTAISAVLSAGNITGATSQINGILEGSRAYAMANNTYVYVGFDEINANGPATTPGVGQVVVSAVASITGLTPTSSNITSLVQAISKPQVINNLHLGDLHAVVTGSLARTAADTLIYNSASGTPQTPSQITFSWPVGPTPPAAQYNFNTVLQIDPQGVVSFEPTGVVGVGPIVPLIELGLQQTRGVVIPPITPGAGGGLAVIQVQGITGKVQIYRP